MARQRLIKAQTKQSHAAIAPNITTKTPNFPLTQPTKTEAPKAPDFQGLSHHLSLPIQAKLTMGQPGDKYEQEADQVANQVVKQLHRHNNSKDDDHIQRQENGRSPKITPLKVSQLQRKTSRKSSPLHSNLERSINQNRGTGKPLPKLLRPRLENAFSTNLSNVRIHDNAQADRLNHSIQAKAFTTGQDIFFRKGAYQPSTHTGQKLLAHELTHTLQQNPQTRTAIQREGEINKLPIEELTNKLKGLSIDEAEKQLLAWQSDGSLSVEVGIIFNENGDLALAKPGEATSIDLDETSYKLSGTKFGKRKITHNHPSGSALTFTDINHAWSNGATEIRAVGKYGVSIAYLDHIALGRYDRTAAFSIVSNKETPGQNAWKRFCPNPTAKKKKDAVYVGKTFGGDQSMGKYFTVELIGLEKGIITNNDMNWEKLYTDRYNLYHSSPPLKHEIPKKPTKQDIDVKKKVVPKKVLKKKVLKKKQTGSPKLKKSSSLDF